MSDSKVTRQSNNVLFNAYTLSISVGKTVRSTFPLSRCILVKQLRDSNNAITTVRFRVCNSNDNQSQWCDAFEGFRFWNPDMSFDTIELQNAGNSVVTIVFYVAIGQLDDFSPAVASTIPNPLPVSLPANPLPVSMAFPNPLPVQEDRLYVPMPETNRQFIVFDAVTPQSPVPLIGGMQYIFAMAFAGSMVLMAIVASGVIVRRVGLFSSFANTASSINLSEGALAFDLYPMQTMVPLFISPVSFLYIYCTQTPGTVVVIET